MLSIQCSVPAREKYNFYDALTACKFLNQYYNDWYTIGHNTFFCFLSSLYIKFQSSNGSKLFSDIHHIVFYVTIFQIKRKQCGLRNLALKFLLIFRRFADSVFQTNKHLHSMLAAMGIYLIVKSYLNIILIINYWIMLKYIKSWRIDKRLDFQIKGKLMLISTIN